MEGQDTIQTAFQQVAKDLNQNFPTSTGIFRYIYTALLIKCPEIIYHLRLFRVDQLVRLCESSCQGLERRFEDSFGGLHLGNSKGFYKEFERELNHSLSPWTQKETRGLIPSSQCIENELLNFALTVHSNGLDYSPNVLQGRFYISTYRDKAKNQGSDYTAYINTTPLGKNTCFCDETGKIIGNWVDNTGGNGSTDGGSNGSNAIVATNNHDEEITDTFVKAINSHLSVSVWCNSKDMLQRIACMTLEKIYGVPF